jgi:hypothetical protein
VKRVNKDIEEKDDGLFPPKSQTAVTVEGWCQLFCWLKAPIVGVGPVRAGPGQGCSLKGL